MARHIVFLFLFVVGCNSVPQPKINVPPPAVDTLLVHYSFSDLNKNTQFDNSISICQLNSPRYSEVSGIAASKINLGMLYLEEDSGNPNQIQLVDQNCAIAATYVTYHGSNRDWEDLAVGPGPLPDKSYLYVADIGDNHKMYPTKFVYRLEERSLVNRVLPVQDTIVDYDIIQLKLPDGVFNAEAFMIDPLTKDLYLVTKDLEAGVYVAPYPQDLTKIVTMKKIAILPFTNITAGDISPDGTELVLKTTAYICYWKKSGSESIADLIRKAPTMLPYSIEPQGEAICFAADETGYYTVSERLDFTVAQPISFYKRK